MVGRSRDAALGCEFWQPSRNPLGPARFSTPSACHRGPLQWLRPAATHNPHSSNSDGEPSALAEVSPTHSLFRNSLKIPSLNPCAPQKSSPRSVPESPLPSARTSDFFPDLISHSQETLFESPMLELILLAIVRIALVTCGTVFYSTAHVSESTSACSNTVWVAFSCLSGG